LQRCARMCGHCRMRPMSSPFASWIVVAVALIVAETLVVYLLRRVAPEVSVGWSAAVIGFSYVLPSAAFVVSDLHGVATPTIVFAVAVGFCSVTAPVRSPLIGADERGEGERR
jgi:hypothetical protein